MSLISQAFAQDAASAAAGEPGMLMQLAPLFIVFIIFYILVIRPQSKRIKEHHNMLDDLKKGDKIVTGGGIKGKITKVSGDAFTVEIAKGVTVEVLKSTIGDKIDPKGSK